MLLLLLLLLKERITSKACQAPSPFSLLLCCCQSVRCMHLFGLHWRCLVIDLPLFSMCLSLSLFRLSFLSRRAGGSDPTKSDDFFCCCCRYCFSVLSSCVSRLDWLDWQSSSAGVPGIPDWHTDSLTLTLATVKARVDLLTDWHSAWLSRATFTLKRIHACMPRLGIRSFPPSPSLYLPFLLFSTHEQASSLFRPGISQTLTLTATKIK